ncbi:MAG: hypothetical protein F6K48_32365 [Okeania sp. SIO3H1]|nr:hypothetical protein [Okeania sp. SIO3H1]
MLVIAVLAIIFVPYYHLVEAPKNLAYSWNKDHPEMYIELDSEDGFAAYKLPYLCYLPYSLIHYIILWLPIVSVTIYAATKDYIFLNIYQNKIRDKQTKIALFKQGKFDFLNKKNICKKIANNFTDFSRIFVEKLGNYTSVFLGINIWIAFEVTVGSQTLAEEAIVWLGASYFIWAVALLIILLTYSYYEKYLQKSGNLLSELKFKNIGKFEDENSVIMFLKRVFNTYFNLYLGLLLTTIILILAFVTPVH